MTRRIKAPKDNILNILHDAPKLIGFNPLVVVVRPDDKKPGLWDVTDSLTILGCITTRVNYTIFMKATEDGVNSEVIADQLGFNVKTSSVFTVTEVEENVCDVVENYTIMANAFIMSYVKSVQRSSHKQLFDKLQEILEKPE